MCSVVRLFQIVAVICGHHGDAQSFCQTENTLIDLALILKSVLLYLQEISPVIEDVTEPGSPFFQSLLITGKNPCSNFSG
jgi:hypothetical protein